MPLLVNLDEFLKAPIKAKANKVFTFGYFSSLENRKDPILLYSFQQGTQLLAYTRIIMRFVAENKLNNVKVEIKNKDNKEHLADFQKIDAYVSPSKRGEGFSIIPRKSMALGIPKIVTDNTAQKTICNSRLVSCVESNIKKANYESMPNDDDWGNYYDFRAEDLAQAM
ncbi:glycosyl transferase group 1 [Hyalomma marginatum]|uniref:Glycosyl transferase group 1 n=1 Tax=Hyalomma marginatum TaxID=34627 RepID=A0A8S4C0V2_9ACAR|nr:glycosyl transferase group 1 [Hyalomma marginatum]